jgi:hypothetical protein
MPAVYRIHVDTDDNLTYTTNISADVLRLSWRLGMQNPYHLIAAHSVAEMTLYNRDQSYSPEYPGSPLRIGRRLRIGVQPDAPSPMVTHFVGFIRSVKTITGELGERLAVVRVTGGEEEYEQTPILMPLQVNVGADDVLDHVFDTPPLTRIPTNFESGISRLSYVGDLWGDGVTAARAIREMVEAERGRFFYRRDGTAVFYNRHHLLRDASPEATFTDDMAGMTYDYGANTVNRVRVRVRPRQIGAAGSVLWTMNHPQAIRAGHTHEIIARLYDSSGQRIGALTVIPPVAYTDYTASDGSGTDRTAQLVVGVALISGGAVKLTLYNSGGDTLYAQMQLRGTPVYPGDSVLVEQQDAAAQLANGIRTLSLSLPALDSLEAADGLARFELQRRGLPQGEALTLELDERHRFEDALRLTLFQRIRVIESQTAHDAEYFIVAEEHEVAAGGYKHRVVWTLERVQPLTYWTLNQSVFNAETRLAY